MSQLTNYLDMEIELLKRNNPNREGFLSLGDFVRRYGIQWDVTRTKPCRRGPPKQCFRNAALKAISDKKLTYVEGYAAGVIPVMHAWCVTPDWEIIETTWNKVGSEYLGIPFRTDYLKAALMKHERYGLIDRWEHDFPILTEPPELWLNPVLHPTFNRKEKP